MKTFNKLDINPERILKNQELITLKGGTNTFPPFLICKRPGLLGGDCQLSPRSCDIAYEVCDEMCPGWESNICIGGEA